MRTQFYLRSILTLVLAGSFLLLKAQAGTADGTYNFAALGVENSAGAGFKTQQDKFAVSNIFLQDGTTMYANNITNGATQTVVIKAEGGALNKRFSLRNMSFFNFSLSDPLSQFTLSLWDNNGVQIAQHTLAANQPMSPTPVSLSAFNFTVPFPAGGYDNVERIEITFGYSGSITPDELTFGNITIANVSNISTLPLGLLDFTAGKEGPGVRIKWFTANEVNVARHILEHSLDGIQFTPLAQFPGTPGSTTTLSYTYLHANPSSKNYYRLKEVGTDGKEKTFIIRRVDFGKSSLMLAGHNPVKNNVQLKGLPTGTYQMALIDMSGRTRVQAKMTINSGDLFQLELPSSLPGGMYTLFIWGNGESFALKIIKE
jgi:hypothetical protein